MLKFFLILLCIVFCCAPAPVYMPAERTVELNLSLLNRGERSVVKEAMDSWRRQTRGCIEFQENDLGIPILEMKPENKYDSENGRYVLGYTHLNNVEISFTRLISRDQGVIVVIHELGHVIGLPHVMDNTAAVMAPVITSKTGRALTREDRDLLYQATGCH